MFNPIRLILDLWDEAPHAVYGRCSRWDADLVHRHILGDLGIGLAYLVIPLVLLPMAVRGRRLPAHHRVLLGLFALFILGCGGTHFAEVYTIFVPDLERAATLKLSTAAISWLTVVVLVAGIRSGATERIATTFLTRLAGVLRAWTGLVVALIVLIIIGGLAYDTTRQSTVHARSHRDAGVVARIVERYYAAIREAESGQRGYLLTGRDAYLIPYHEAIPLLRSWRLDLQVAAVTDPALDRATDAKLAEMADTIRRARAGDREGALAIVLSDHGRLLMREIDARLDGIRVRLDQSLAVEDARLAIMARRTLAAITFGGTAAVAMVVLAFVALRRELTLRRAVEAALRATEAALRQSNVDLEQFAYAASHDLQQPLRAIGGFVGLLGQRYDALFDETAKGWIDRVKRATKRMQQMIDDLLEWSRLSTRPAQPETFPLAEAADEALANLQEAIAEAGAAVVVGALPEVHASRRHCVQIFQNLIGNAIKYRHPDRNPQVTIGVADPAGIAGRIVVTVTDNGAGIAPEDYARIFDVFVRLDPSKPGTGVGLAIVRRAVERNGGIVWVESAPGIGSTFCFTLALPISGAGDDHGSLAALMQRPDPAGTRVIS
jgi:signal transduction histidine kinase